MTHPARRRIGNIRPPKGASNTPEYRSWQAMRHRCHGNPSHPAWRRYGGRGIWVCVRWRQSFVDFLADMGPRPTGTSIDRIDPDGNYEPGNCRWATQRDQTLNRSTAKRLTIDGVTRTVSGWAVLAGVSPEAIHGRLRRGWSHAMAVYKPIRGTANGVFPTGPRETK